MPSRHSTRSRALALAGTYLLSRGLARRRLRTLAGQVVLITGGSRGLGLALAREFARQGCALVLCARDPVELEQARKDIAYFGVPVLAIPCDVTIPADVERLVATAHAELGRIDVLVNNASIIQVGPLASMTLDDFRRAMETNFWGTLHATLAVLPRMRERRAGRIVNITSIGGKVAVPHLLPYDCAKFAVVGLSEGLRAELARDGVAVTTVVPGLMRTGSPLHAEFKNPAEFAWFSAGAILPFFAMSAARAARRIVQATARGEAEVTLTTQARILRLVHDLFPGVTATLLGVANRLLPVAQAAQVAGSVKGRALPRPRLLRWLLARTGRKYNELGAAPPPLPAG